MWSSAEKAWLCSISWAPTRRLRKSPNSAQKGPQLLQCWVTQTFTAVVCMNISLSNVSRWLNIILIVSSLMQQSHGVCICSQMGDKLNKLANRTDEGEGVVQPAEPAAPVQTRGHLGSMFWKTRHVSEYFSQKSCSTCVPLCPPR